MRVRQSFSTFQFFALSALLLAAMAGCGGGGGGGGSGASAGGPGPGNPPDAGPTAMPDPDQQALAMPSNISNGSTVELQCGRYYQGTLDLRGRSNVTVRVSGDCGRAIITPSQPVSGWTAHQGNIYSAPVSFHPVQVIIGAQPLSQAHWPTQPQTWVRAEGANAESLRYPMPNSDLVGATLIFKPFEWAVEARRITAYSDGVMTLAPTGNPNYDGYALNGQVQFYVEGKLWMLDEPGEWAFSNGRLYVWAPDGQSPEGRVWATPDQHGIDAGGSRDVTLDGVSISGAVNGVQAYDAVNLTVLNADISNSAGNGIINSGGSGLTVENSVIRNARHDGITVRWRGNGTSVRNSRIDRAGAVGMPVNTHGAVVITLADGSSITGNAVTSSGYIAIRAFRNATVAGNSIDAACIVLSDCGGIYVSAHDRQPLNTRIENNRLTNVGRSFRLSWGLYLDEGANAVTVANNRASGGYNGLLIHNGFNNTISGNTFSDNRQSQIQMAESGAGTLRGNVVTGNSFTIRGTEEAYRVSSDFGTGAVALFGTYNNNTFTSSSSIFANFNGEALQFEQWKARTGQDLGSVLAVP